MVENENGIGKSVVKFQQLADLIGESPHAKQFIKELSELSAEGSKQAIDIINFLINENLLHS